MRRIFPALPLALAILSCAPRSAAETTLTLNVPGKAPIHVGLPLRTEGPYIVDRNGARVRLRGVNWFGAESAEFVVGGLDRQKLDAIVRLIRDGGFNSVRLPWSNELVARNPIVPAAHVAANPELAGLRGMDVLDRVVDALGRAGLMVILDNHRSRADWCCDEAHGDGLWHTPEFPEEAWIAHWRQVARRYADRPFVVAAELRNEIRPDPSQSLTPSWGDGNAKTDWRAAAMRGAEAVLAENPRLLIVVGGLDYQARLEPVRDTPVRLSVPGRLVYAAHDYVWIRKPEELAEPAAFARRSWERWGYLREPGRPYTAPVYVSEFGGCIQSGSEGQACPDDSYVRTMAEYLRKSGEDWAWWPLNGTQSAGYDRKAGAVETYGLLDPTWSHYVDPALVKALTD